LSGYDTPEKIQIAQQYLIPKAITSNGLENQKVEMTDKATESLIRGYCREAGVRNLEKHVDKIMRKLSYKVAKVKEERLSEEVGAKHPEEVKVDGGDQEKEEDGQREEALKWDPTKETGCDMLNKQVPEDVDCIITPERLVDLVGKPAFTTERLFEGRSDSKAALEITGQLGKVMSESTKIALTVAKKVVNSVQPDSKFFDTSSIHLHFPEGATPKDGPSAGVTIATALCSLALNRSVKDNLAMTGELSLSGLVLPIGGVKEKAIAAVRAGVTTLCLPLQNKHDAVELPEYLRRNLTICFVRNFDEVAHIALGVGSPALETEILKPTNCSKASADRSVGV
ncbi:ATP-dependent Lon protease pim1, partial [Perkinsus chesapeaki]